MILNIYLNEKSYIKTEQVMIDWYKGLVKRIK